MKSRLANRCQKKNSRGAVLPLVGILLFVFLGIAALAIDIGYRNTTQNELQNVADSAALAGAGFLGSVYASDAYQDLTPSQQMNYIFNRSEIVSVVRDAAEKNKAAGVNIFIRDEDITVGEWNPDADFFQKGVNLKGNITTPTLTNPSAVKVIARRDEQANSPISTFFAQIFNFDTLPVQAVAAAALTGQANFEPGEIKLPFALSRLQFPNACRNPVTFTSNTDCAAWHTFTQPSLNNDQLRDMLYGMILDHPDGSAWLASSPIRFPADIPPPVFTSPPVEGGVTAFTFTEGTNAALFTGTPSPMQALFDFWKTRDDDDDDSVWTTAVPVYKEPPDAFSCTPTSRFEPRIIVGAADIIVTAVNGPPGNSIDVIITCSFKPMRGSGGDGGTRGTIPNLVR